VIGFGILDVVKHEGVVGCEGRGKQSAKGKEKVLRGKGRSIGPLGILAKLENPFVGPFRINGVPFGRHAGQSDSVLGGVRADQTLEKSPDNVALENAAHDMRIQSLGLGSVAHDENPILGSLFHAAASLA
jgi:hypothetical protein